VGTSTAERSPEALAFRQRRVALFGLASGGLGLIFLLFRAVVAVSERDYQEFQHPSFLYHLLAVMVGLSAWLICGTSARSSRVTLVAEALALVGVSVAYQLMGWHLPLAARPETIVLLATNYIFMAWAAFVPSPPQRTLVLSLAVGVPLVIGTYVVYLGADEAFLRGASIEPLLTSTRAARVLATWIAVWWSLTTVLATATRSVIYGLRRDVEEARKLGQYRSRRSSARAAWGSSTAPAMPCCSTGWPARWWKPTRSHSSTVTSSRPTSSSASSEASSTCRRCWISAW